MEAYLISLITTYQYALLIPLGFVEGQLISLLCGFLASQGKINPLLAGLFIGFGNLAGDSILYFLGRSQGSRVTKRVRGWLNITPDKVERGTEIFQKNSSAILFLSKITNGFGLSFAILFTAGSLRVPYRTFITWNALGEILWTGGLILAGYWFGTLYSMVDAILFRIGLLSLVATALVVLVISVRRYLKQMMQ
jgi:membrane protein DedA with SNARE-associated domain